MKITKRQLRRIIREEKAKLLKAKLLREAPQDNLKLLATVIDNLTEMALGYDADDEMRGELRMQVELLNDVYSSMYNKTMMREKDEVPMLKVGDLDGKDKESKGMYGQSMKKKKKK